MAWLDVRQVLVETMLEQKVHNSNERIAAQEALLVQLTETSQQQQQQQQGYSANDLQWTNNAKFLHDMVQQVINHTHAQRFSLMQHNTKSNLTNLVCLDILSASRGCISCLVQSRSSQQLQRTTTHSSSWTP